MVHVQKASQKKSLVKFQNQLNWENNIDKVYPKLWIACYEVISVFYASITENYKTNCFAYFCIFHYKIN